MINNDNFHLQIEKKTRFLILFSIIILFIYSIYLFYLQVIRFNEFRNRASLIKLRSETLPAQRGIIFESSGLIPLVLNIDSFAVQIIPAEIPKKEIDTVFSKLASVLSIPVDDIYKKILPSQYKLYQPSHDNKL